MTSATAAIERGECHSCEGFSSAQPSPIVTAAWTGSPAERHTRTMPGWSESPPGVQDEVSQESNTLVSSHDSVASTPAASSTVLKQHEGPSTGGHVPARCRACECLGVTLSIIAFDAETETVGAAVTTCQLAGGRRIIQVRPGIGAVAVQDGAEIPWRESVLDAIAAGSSPASAIEPYAIEDVQVAAVDFGGRVAAHTGTGCGAPAGHAVDGSVSAQANLAALDGAWNRMLEAFHQADGPLAERLVAALRASGGDKRGWQSAAVLVTSTEPLGGWPDEPHVDLRVDDHQDPIVELERLLRLHRAHLALLGSLDEADPAARRAVLEPLVAEHPEDPLLRQFLDAATRTSERKS